MTSSGGDLNVHIDRLHQHASQRRVQAADFITDKPPPVPDDPDDPTTGAAGDLTSDVHGVNRALHAKTYQRADKIDADGNSYSQQDQGAGSQVGAINGGGSQKQAASGLTDVGIGSIMNSLLAPLGQMVSGATQGVNGLAGAAFQGVSTGVGQGINVAGQLGSAMAKTTGVGSVGGAGGGGALPGETAGADSGGGEQTKSASATSPLSQNGGEPTSPRRNGDYATPEDRNDTHTVQSTGMGTPGMAGLGAAGGGGGSGSFIKPRMYKVHADGVDPVDPPTEPIPAITEVAYAASPLMKEPHDADT